MCFGKGDRRDKKAKVTFLEAMAFVTVSKSTVEFKQEVRRHIEPVVSTYIFLKNLAYLPVITLCAPTENNGMVTALKSKAQEVGFAFKSGNHTILLCWWL